MNSIKIFEYLEEYDAFVPTLKYKHIADYLGLSEWNPVVWIGRLFTLDNDYGEHWFDNHEIPIQVERKINKNGFSIDDLLFLDPDRFKNDNDGPCNTKEMRKRFWTDVCQSLSLSLELLFDKARENNQYNKKLLEENSDDPDYNENYISDLEKRIDEIRNLYGK